MNLALKDGKLDHLMLNGLNAKLFLEAPPGTYQLRAVTQEAIEGRMTATTSSVEIKWVASACRAVRLACRQIVELTLRDIEIKRAARLISLELATARALAGLAITKRYWIADVKLSTKAWQKYGGTIAPDLSYLAESRGTGGDVSSGSAFV